MQRTQYYHFLMTTKNERGRQVNGIGVSYDVSSEGVSSDERCVIAAPSIP
jgi:hypothetical protein